MKVITERAWRGPEQLAQHGRDANGCPTWLGYRAVETARFMVNGRTYHVKRDAATKEVCYVGKRARTNACGVHYVPMNVKGKAAREVLAALIASGVT